MAQARGGANSDVVDQGIFGDFVCQDAAQMVEALTERSGPIYLDGIGYMYGNPLSSRGGGYRSPPAADGRALGQVSVDRGGGCR